MSPPASNAWVRWANTCDAERDLTAAAEWLEDWERRKLDQFRSRAAAGQFAAARHLLRVTLSGVVNCHPWEVRLGTEPSGRPQVKAPAKAMGLWISISHCHKLAACAVSQHPIGVDIEPLDVNIDATALAKFVIGPNECVAESRGATETDAFLRAWTLKEAYLKATGQGLSVDLRNIEFDLRGDTPRLSGVAAGTEGWRFWSRELSSRHILAVALRAEGGVRLDWACMRDQTDTRLAIGAVSAPASP